MQGLIPGTVSYKESAREVSFVRSLGACLWVLIGLLVLVGVIAYWPVSGVTDAPYYARTILYLSTAHQFAEVKEVLGTFSPPPPSF